MASTTITAGFGFGIRLYEATACQVVDSTGIANQIGFYNNVNAPFASFFGNRSETNSIADFLNIPTGNIVTFDKTLATFVPTPPNRWSNITIDPS